MTNISNILLSGNYTPKERIIFQIHSKVEEEKTGIEKLNKADIAALRNWQPQSRQEFEEYNQIHEAWILEAYVKLELEIIARNQTIYLLQAQRNMFLLYYVDFHFLAESVMEEYEIVDIELEQIIFDNSWVNYQKFAERYGEDAIEDLGLVIQERSGVKVITSKSILDCKSDSPEVEKVKEDFKVLKKFVLFCEFIRKGSLLEEYHKLKQFEEIYVEFSRIFEIDMSHVISNYTRKVGMEIIMFNAQLSYTLQDILDEDSLVEFDLKNFEIKFDSEAEDEFEIIGMYKEKLKMSSKPKILRDRLMYFTC